VRKINWKNAIGYVVIEALAVGLSVLILAANHWAIPEDTSRVLLGGAGGVIVGAMVFWALDPHKFVVASGRRALGEKKDNP